MLQAMILKRGPLYLFMILKKTNSAKAAIMIIIYSFIKLICRGITTFGMNTIGQAQQIRANSFNS
jgi:hypothetical protein